MHRCPVCNTVTESWGWAGGPGRIGVLKVCPRCGWRGWVETQIEQEVPEWSKIWRGFPMASSLAPPARAGAPSAPTAAAPASSRRPTGIGAG